MKTCKHCGKNKELKEFVKSSLTNDGTISTCKECNALRRQKISYEVTLKEKKCFCCKKIKQASEFPKNCRLSGGLHTWCKSCVNEKHKIAKYTITSREVRRKKMIEDPVFGNYIRTQKNENRKKNITTSILKNCKTRAQINNLAFDLVKKDIVIPEICPVLLKPIKCGDKNNYSFSPSIDRIDNNKGYTKDNIQVISMKANKMKNNATQEELINFANWVLKTK